MAMPFDLAVGEWWQSDIVTPGTISAVYASPDPGLGGSRPNITDAWVGAAYDSSRKYIAIKGGGHDSYHGNEVYGQCLDSLSANFLKWEILNYYSAPTLDSEDNADSTPTSIHSYCNFVYNPTRDVIVRLPGCSPDTGAGTFTVRTYEFDASTRSPSVAVPSAWVRKADAPGGTDAACGVSAYDPQTGLVYKVMQGTYRLYSFNGGTNAWASLGSTDFVLNSTFNSCSAIGVVGGISYFAVCGGGNMQVLRMSDFTFLGSESDYNPSGDTAIEGSNSPGLGWDENSEQFVGWNGLLSGGTDRRDYYTLDVLTKVWTRNTGTGDIPTAPLANGTYTRFQPYRDGLFSYVHNTTTATYFLRVSETNEEPPVSETLMRKVIVV